MSIIHEALKKVQSNRSENTSIVAKTTAEKRTIPQQSKNSMHWWILLVSVLAGITIYNLYEYTRTTREMSATKFYASQLSVVANEPGTSTALPKPPQPKKDELILSGVVEMDGKNFALINNEFYEVGEKAAGRKITKITTDSVEILEKGKTRIIKVLRPD